MTVDLRGGPLDGGSVEPLGLPEVELIVDLSSGKRDRLIVRAPAAGGVLVAGAGGVALNGDADADVLAAGVEELVFGGGEGPDTFSGAGGRGTGGPADGALTLKGEAGDDSLTGGRGPDRLLGGAGRDDLSGGRGNDVLIGSPDRDREAGGGGNDRFEQGPAPDGNDVLFGQGGRDTVAYSERRRAVYVSIGVKADDGELGQIEEDRVGSDVEVVVGGRGNDVLLAPARATTGFELNGRRGDDVIFAGEGDDILRGGPGDDAVIVHARARTGHCRPARQNREGAGNRPAPGVRAGRRLALRRRAARKRGRQRARRLAGR